MSPVTHPPDPAALIRQEMRGRVLLAVVDMPGRTMNVFSVGLMDALEALVGRVESDDGIDALVLTSGKPAFIAGADLDMVRGFCAMGRTATRDALHETCGRLGRLFVRLEALAKPTVAALNGLALGGGLEVAMACRWRIAANDPRLQLGLPEIKLGLLPGAGGTQRLPRLVGFEKGVDLLLSGKSVSSAEALTLGLVDEVAPPAELVDRAVVMAQAAVGRASPPKFPPRLSPGPFDLRAPETGGQLARHFGYTDDVTALYPAYDAIIRCVVEAADMPLPAGTALEMERFVDLMQDEVAGNMVSTLFLWRQKADKQVAGALATARRFALTGSDPQIEALRSALGAAKATIVDAAEAGQDDVVIARREDTAEDGLAVVLMGGGSPAGAALVHLARSRSFGTALEIVTPDTADGVPMALALARALRATPYVHGGRRSLLAELARTARQAADADLPGEAVLAALAIAADRIRATGHVGDVEMADVASVVSGVFPAHAGGPFTWLASHGGADLERIRASNGSLAPDLFR